MALAVLGLAASAQAMPPTFSLQPTCAGSELKMTTGPNASGGITSPCANGSGDEICGLYLVLQPGSGVSLTGFTPSDPKTRVDAGTFPTTGRIVRVNPAGDFGTVSLGCLSVSGPPGGTVTIAAASEAVDARLQGIPLQTTSLPEPGAWLSLFAGGAALLLLARRRAAASALLLCALVSSAPAEAQFYLDREGFENAIGAGFEIEDFESIPLDGNNHAAFSNGAAFGGGAFAWSSLSLPADVPLSTNAGPTGLQGTLLIASGEGFPGATGATGSPESEDSFTLTFSTPVGAAGLRISSNSVEVGESISFLDAWGQVLATRALPSSYVGYVSEPGMNPIAEIRVEESVAGTDDILFDDVIWKQSVALAAPPIDVPQPRLEEWSHFGYPDFPIEANDQFGFSAVGLGDLDDDGVPDLAISAQGDDDGNAQAGAVYIAFMERNGSIRNLRKISQTSGRLTGFGNPGGLFPVGEEFGSGLAAPGDLDGDGVEDLVVGAASSPPRFYVLFLAKDGNVRSYQRVSATEGGFVGPIASGDRFGATLASLGDVDGDGVVDLAVGADSDDDDGTNSGSVWVLFMNADGTVKGEQKISGAEGGFGSGLGGADNFGRGLAGIGDIDRDGVPDVAIGAQGDDDAANSAGAVWIVFLNTDGTVRGKQKILPQSFGVFFGSSSSGLVAQFGRYLSWIPTPNAPTPGVLAVGAPFAETLWPSFDTTIVIGTGAVHLLVLDETGAAIARSGVARSLPPPWLVGIPGVFDPTVDESVQLSMPAYIGDLDDDGAPEMFASAPTATVSGGPAASGHGFLWRLTGLDSSAYADAALAGASPYFLGAPDNLGIGFNGTATVQFLDNVAFADGTSQPDLVVHRHIPDVAFTKDATIQVEASTDGGSFSVVKPTAVYPAEVGLFGTNCGTGYLLPCPANEFLLVNLDQGGFGPTDPIRFIRITHSYDSDCGPFPCQPEYVPRIDAIEAYNTASTLSDKDYDGIPDGFDNCRSFHNPSQQDADGDGWGDFCDNCPDFGNPDQESVCSEAALRLTPSSGHGIGLEWQLDLLCGSDPIEFVNIGLIAPSGTDPDTLKFGADPAKTLAGCGPPAASQVLPGVPTGTGCAPLAGSSLLLDALEASTSGALDPVDTLGLSGVRNDTLYLLLGYPTGPDLCSGDHEEVRLGFVSVDDPLAPIDDPIFTTQGTDVVTFEDPWGFAAGVNGAGDPAITLSLTPSTSGSLYEYEVCVVSDRSLNRLTFAIETPAGLTTNGVRWKGCTTLTGGAQSERSCSSGTYPNVAGASSRTWGPTASDPTMFVQLGGSIPVGFDLIPALNPTANELTCLGLIEVTGSAFVPALSANEIGTVLVQPPIRVAEDQNPLDGSPDAFALPSCSTPGVQGACVATSSSLNAPDDYDNDGVRDESDNCVFVSNAGQENGGGLLSTDPAADTTHLGDACQCGDADVSGRMLVNEADVDLMLDYILGKSTVAEVGERCSVSRGATCDIVDAARLEAGLAGKNVTLEPACVPTLAP